jgi:hypothetical protein
LQVRSAIQSPPAKVEFLVPIHIAKTEAQRLEDEIRTMRNG